MNLRETRRLFTLLKSCTSNKNLLTEIIKFQLQAVSRTSNREEMDEADNEFAMTNVHIDPVILETLMATGLTEEQAAAQEKVKPWFKRAVERMELCKKSHLIGGLAITKAESTDEKEKQEIEAEIKRLLGEEGDKRFEKMKEFIAKTKGWTIDATGKVAELWYLTDD